MNIPPILWEMPQHVIEGARVLQEICAIVSGHQNINLARAHSDARESLIQVFILTFRAACGDRLPPTLLWAGLFFRGSPKMVVFLLDAEEAPSKKTDPDEENIANIIW